MKTFRCLVIGLCLAAAVPLTAEDAVPEIRITFNPADGYSPADGVAPVYQFVVVGTIPSSNPAKPFGVSTEMLLKPGHTRRVYREFENLKLEGDVKVDERGILMYRIALSRAGVRIATSSSSVSWTHPATPSMYVPQ